ATMRDRLMQSGAAHWDGEFSVFVADDKISEIYCERTDRTLRHARYGLLQPGCWMRPSNIAVPFSNQNDSQPIGLHAMRARLPHPRSLVTRLWDLESWNARAETLIELENETIQLLTDEGGSGIRVACLVISAASGLAAADPLLPPALAPPGWLSTAAHIGFYRLDELTRAILAEHLEIEPV
ncbi:MAG: hypothetical protein ACC652_10255, partial [Acidimicrobiales bacterium]